MTAICFSFLFLYLSGWVLFAWGGRGWEMMCVSGSSSCEYWVCLSILCQMLFIWFFSKTQNGPGDGSPAAGMTGALQVESQKKSELIFCRFSRWGCAELTPPGPEGPRWLVENTKGEGRGGVTFCKNVTSNKQEQRPREKRSLYLIWLARRGEGIQRWPFFFFLPLVLSWKEHGERRITQGRAASPRWRVTVGRRKIRQQDNRFPKWQRRCRTMRDWQMNNETSRCTSGAFVRPLKIYWYWWCLYQWCDPDFLQRWY